MKKQFFVFLLLGLVSAALIIGVRLRKSGEAEQSSYKSPSPGQAEAALKKGEEKQTSDLSLSLREILNRVCEHSLPTYQCAECRYEVGVVKVDKSLLMDEQNPEKGLVRIVPAAKQKVTVSLNTTGEIKLNENRVAHISPKIEGIIRSVNVDIGAVVKKGAPLFTLESQELGAALGEYLKNRSLVDLRAKTYAREKSLYEQKISPEQDMLEAKTAFQEAQADLKTAQQRLRILGFSEKEIAGITSDDYTDLPGILTIRAPLDGTIIEKHVVTGERVAPDSDLMVLADLDTVWVWGNIYESDLLTLLQKKNDGPIPIEVRQLAFPNEVFHGHLDYVGATMDEQTRTVKVRASIDNQKNLLRPGVFCEVTILLGSGEEIPAIPKAALLSDEGVFFVYKHLKDDYYVRRQVKKGREFAGSVEILEGIEPGELIVADGAFLLKSDTLRSKMGAGCAD